MGAEDSEIREEDQLGSSNITAPQPTAMRSRPTTTKKMKLATDDGRNDKKPTGTRQETVCKKRTNKATTGVKIMTNVNNSNVNNNNATNSLPSGSEELINKWTGCFFTNADVLTNKMPELKLRVSTDCPGINGISEVKPKSGTELSMNLLKIPDYEIMYNTNFQERTERGTIIYVHKNLLSRAVQVDLGLCDSVFVEIKLGNNSTMLIGCIYRHHNSSEADDNTLMDTLRRIAYNKKYSHTVLAGDFNLPGIDWTDWHTNSRNITRDHCFIECIRDCFWHQHVSMPTRGRGTDRPSVLDLIFSDDKNIVGDVNIQSPLGKSNHSVLSFKLNTDLATEKTVKPRFVYDKGDYEQMNEELGLLDWKQIFSECPDTETMCNKLNQYIVDSVNKHIPKTRGGKKKVSSKTTLDKKALGKIKKKYKLWQRYLKTRNGEIYQEYCRARNQVRRLTRKAIRNLEKDIAKQAKVNPKNFWAYVNSKMTTRNGVPDLVIPGPPGEEPQLTSTDTEKAEVLNSFFTSVFTKENDSSVDPEKQEVKYIMQGSR